MTAQNCDCPHASLWQQSRQAQQLERTSKWEYGYRMLNVQLPSSKRYSQRCRWLVGLSSSLLISRGSKGKWLQCQILGMTVRFSNSWGWTWRNRESLQGRTVHRSRTAKGTFQWFWISGETFMILIPFYSIHSFSFSTVSCFTTTRN